MAPNPMEPTPSLPSDSRRTALSNIQASLPPSAVQNFNYAKGFLEQKRKQVAVDWVRPLSKLWTDLFINYPLGTLLISSFLILSLPSVFGFLAFTLFVLLASICAALAFSGLCVFLGGLVFFLLLSVSFIVSLAFIFLVANSFLLFHFGKCVMASSSSEQGFKLFFSTTVSHLRPSGDSILVSPPYRLQTEDNAQVPASGSRKGEQESNRYRALFEGEETR